MVRIAYIPDQYRLIARGHAGSGEPGHDLVCAGVSALVLALREKLNQMEKAGLIRLKVAAAELGAAQFWCSPEKGSEELLAAVMDTVVGGMALLQKLFGEFVELRINTTPDLEGKPSEENIDIQA